MNCDASRTVTLQREPPILDTDVSPNEQAAPVRVSLSFVNSFGGQSCPFPMAVMMLNLTINLNIYHFSLNQEKEGGTSDETVTKDQTFDDTVRVSDCTHQFLFLLKITFFALKSLGGRCPPACPG